MASRDPDTPPSRAGPSAPIAPGVSSGPGVSPDPVTPGSRPGSVQTDPARKPGDRRGRMLADSAVVEEWPVWLEVNGEPAVTWMCTPGQLEELATGWLHGEEIGRASCRERV